MRFPLKTALAFATCVPALVAIHRWNPGKGLSPSIFAETASFPNLRPHPKSLPRPSTQVASAKPGPNPVKVTQIRPPITEFLFDDAGSLDSFFAALLKLDTAPGSAGHVVILHYGDSPTTADLITGDVRVLLQQRFGDAGHGYLLVAKPWAWYGHRNTDISGHGWAISTAVGKGRSETYGLGGASFQAVDGAAGSHITIRGTPQAAMEVSYLAEAGGGTIAISADDDAGKNQPIATVDTATPDGQPNRRPAWRNIPLPPGTTAIDIRSASGRVTVFGESFTRSSSGIVYDSLGLNGASTTVLSRGFDSTAWADELRHDAPALVVINYGTNESGFSSFVDKQYEGELRLAIQRVRSALPNVSILVMSPMDRGEHTGIDEIKTMDTIPRIITIQKRVASEQHCAFFDTFNAMGGDGTMSRWYTGKPRLVAGDLIHPTPQGASVVAQIFVKNLMQGYDSYKSVKTGRPSGTPPPLTAKRATSDLPAAQPGVKKVSQP